MHSDNSGYDDYADRLPERPDGYLGDNGTPTDRATGTEGRTS